jgi:aspartyl protease family protein
MTAKNPEIRYFLFFVMFWVALLGVASIFFGSWQSHQQNPNQDLVSHKSSGVIEIELEANRQGHYVANGQINNKAVTFFLDTGATSVSVPESIAMQAGLEKEYRARSQTAAGTVDVWGTTIETLKLGEITLHNVSATINPATDMDVVLLGMSALGQVDFSQRSGTLTLSTRVN